MIEQLSGISLAISAAVEEQIKVKLVADQYKPLRSWVTPEPGAGLIRDTPKLIAPTELYAYPGRGGLLVFALDEKGERIKVRGDTPNMHDMLTGSDMQGRAYPSNMNLTCSNWKSSTSGSAMLGHGDREGIGDTVYQHSPFAAHMSRDCTQAGLVATGGNGLFYCFAVK